MGTITLAYKWIAEWVLRHPCIVAGTLVDYRNSDIPKTIAKKMEFKLQCYSSPPPRLLSDFCLPLTSCNHYSFWRVLVSAHPESLPSLLPGLILFPFLDVWSTFVVCKGRHTKQELVHLETVQQVTFQSLDLWAFKECCSILAQIVI